MIRFNYSFAALCRDMYRDWGKRLVAKAKANMDEISYGRVYKIRKDWYHIASKWGDPPNNMYGRLKSTIRYSTDKDEMFFGSGGSGKLSKDGKIVNYGTYLEDELVLNRVNLVRTVNETMHDNLSSVPHIMKDKKRLVLIGRTL